MNDIKMVVFDMAGTTIKDQNEVEMCFIKAADQTKLPYTRQDILSMMGWSKKKVFETLWRKALPNGHKSELEELISTSFIEFKTILENHYRTAEIEPTDDCMAIFNQLKVKNIKIALTTGFYREVTNIILQRLGWDKDLDENYLGHPGSLIDVSIASDEVPAGRPEPFMIQRAMQLLNIGAPSVINIGDTPSDLLSGNQAQCIFNLAVTNGTHSHEQLKKYPNDGLLKTIGELKKYI